MLGSWATWILMDSTDWYSFSSGALSGPAPKDLLQLRARSAEQPENGSLSMWETSRPGLLSSNSEPQVAGLWSGSGKLSLVEVPVGSGATGGVSPEDMLLLTGGTVLAGTVLGAVLVDILWSGTKPVGTLGATVPARVELIGSLDGGRLVSTLVDIVPEGFELAGNLEGIVLSNAELVGTLEGATLVANELANTPAPGQMVASPWSPAPPEEAKPGEEEEMPVGGADTEGPGKRLALGMERVSGWKETDGDTGPRGDVRLEAMPAMWALPGSVSCS